MTGFCGQTCLRRRGTRWLRTTVHLGVDGVRVKDIENAPGGVERFVENLHDDLKRKRYRPQAVRLKLIPKANGGHRPLGIPMIRNRVVRTAAKLILEPIFEADFLPVAYGFRPGRPGRLEGWSDSRLRCGSERILRHHPPSPVDGVCRAADRRRCGAQADTSVATGTDHGRTIRPTSTTEEGQATGRHPARGRHQSVVSQPCICTGWTNASTNRKDRPRGLGHGWCAMPMTLSFSPAIRGGA